MHQVLIRMFERKLMDFVVEDCPDNFFLKNLMIVEEVSTLPIARTVFSELIPYSWHPAVSSVSTQSPN